MTKYQVGGPSWTVKLGRRDSTTASRSLADSDLPAPFHQLDRLITLFSNKGFTPREMVALSGNNCVSFHFHFWNNMQNLIFILRACTKSNLQKLVEYSFRIFSRWTFRTTSIILYMQNKNLATKRRMILFFQKITGFIN